MFEILEPSDLDAHYLKHNDFFKWLENLPENKSVALNKVDFNYSLLKNFTQDFNQLNKTSIVVIEHSTCFEVKRFLNTVSIKHYYDFLNLQDKAKVIKNQDGEHILLKFLNEYLNEDLKLSEKYDFSENLQLMKNLKVVKKAYLSRRAGGVSLFKNSNKGASVEISECLQSLVEKGFIVKLSKDDTLKTFKTTAECFEITNEI